MDQGGAQKSLAEIQAEEEGQERDRQERERKEKKARQKGTIIFCFSLTSINIVIIFVIVNVKKRRPDKKVQLFFKCDELALALRRIKILPSSFLLL